ncbi:MAG: hypothetical protein IKV85_09625 [Ruminococcus sp.]|nr:hypothetical protein [Ruminococcus sp.]
MKFRKITAAISACMLAVCCISCEKIKEESVSLTEESVSLPEIGEKGVSELISPADGSDEYELGQYYYSGNGVKLYCGDETVPVEAVLALENYFLTFQNNDFDTYKSTIYPDYAERYEKYLREVYSKEKGVDDYSLKNSFDLRNSMIRDDLIDILVYESTEDKEFKGDYTITRIRAEQPTYEEGVTEEAFVQSFFDSYEDILDENYYEQVKSDVDKLIPFTIFVMARAEDGNEHKIVSTMNIILAEKDGKYYTFG